MAGCVQLRRGMGDEAKEPLEAVQPEEHQPSGEGLPEPRGREEGGGLGQTGVQHRGERSPTQPRIVLFCLRVHTRRVVQLFTFYHNIYFIHSMFYRNCWIHICTLLLI